MSAQPAFHELERVEQRVLGALRCVDAATGVGIDPPPAVRALDAPAPRLVRNRSGRVVIHEWQPLAAHAVAFESPPALPAPGSERLRLAIDDPTGRYLSRIVVIPLPREPGTALLSAQDVPMYPAPAAASGVNWSRLRLSVADAMTGDALGGALLRVLRDGVVLARGISDGRGEALVAVVGVPVTTFSEDENAVIVDRIEVRVDAVWDQRPGLDSSGVRHPAAAISAGSPPPAEPLIDPDALEAAALADLEADVPMLARAEIVLSIAAGESQSRHLSLGVPP